MAYIPTKAILDRGIKGWLYISLRKGSNRKGSNRKAYIRKDFFLNYVGEKTEGTYGILLRLYQRQYKNALTFNSTINQHGKLSVDSYFP